MHSAGAPDPDWYFDNVLVAAEPDGRRVGPVRSRQASWYATAQRLRADAAGTALEAAVDLTCRQGFALSTRQAIDCGVSESTIRTLLRRRRWSRLRRGALSPLAPRDRLAHIPHGLALPVRAAGAALARPGTVVSHDAAATMHGLPVLADDTAPTMSAIDVARSIWRPSTVVRCVGLAPSDVTEWFGVAVTSLERTIIDVARASGVAAGLIAADAALNDDLTTMAALHDARRRASYRPGSAPWIAYSSWCRPTQNRRWKRSRACAWSTPGSRPPELQQVVTTRRGTYRVDMLYRDRRVVVEADGRLKYRGAEPGADDALWSEKLRQEALERAGFTVVRVTWSDVRHEPADVVARVRRALARPPR